MYKGINIILCMKSTIEIHYCIKTYGYELDYTVHNLLLSQQHRASSLASYNSLSH